MLITSTLVHTDLHHNAIQPLPFVYPHVEQLPDPRGLFDKIFKRKHRAAEDDISEIERTKHNNAYTKHGFRYYYWMLVRFIFEGTEMNMIVAKCGPRTWPLRVLWTAAQGALIGIVFGFPLFCLAIVILGPIYGTRNMHGLWAPQAIKAVYACILGWITNPVIAALALGSQADHHLVVVPDEEIAAKGLGTVDAMDTIAEEGDNGPSSKESGSPLPFLRPRTSTLGVPAGQTRSRSDTVSSHTSGLGPRLTPTRSRSNSVVLRPPLTADVSNMSVSPIPPTAPTPTTPRSPAVVRPRGLTVSSYTSTTVVQTGTMPATPSSYTYALGGYGGRARRSRANTTATLPDATILGLGRPTATAGPTPVKDRVSSSPVAGSPSTPQVKRQTRQRTLSDIAGGATHSETLVQGYEDADVDVVKSSDPPSRDVFGETTAVPMLRVQRPSLDQSRSSPRPSTDQASSVPFREREEIEE